MGQGARLFFAVERDLADQSSRAVGNPKFGVGDSFPRSPAKARRPSRIDPADHYGLDLDIDVDGIERSTVVVLGHVDSRGGPRGNLRAAVDQRAERFFSKIFRPAPPSGPPIGSHRGRVWVYVRGCVRVLSCPEAHLRSKLSWRARRRPPRADSGPSPRARRQGCVEEIGALIAETL
jgi:hypothetical protein